MSSKSVASTITSEKLISASTTTSSSILKNPPSEKYMQWWFLGPVALAVLMFLLMGTIFERRIEALWQNVLERRQAVLSQATECTETQQNTVSLNTERTPSQKTIYSEKAATACSKEDIKLATSKDNVNGKTVKIEDNEPKTVEKCDQDKSEKKEEIPNILQK
ncbi:uncharacterized protein LOC142981206 isoform X1 [Anticarsia gemmatalis]|uniref:uncharacterized protein LOC142981206 isoform X1 n=1 Tax=Anticarsia gemmatalis TaxID=129554 RepID=UPI003F76B82F